MKNNLRNSLMNLYGISAFGYYIGFVVLHFWTVYISIKYVGLFWGIASLFIPVIPNILMVIKLLNEGTESSAYIMFTFISFLLCIISFITAYLLNKLKM